MGRGWGRVGEGLQLSSRSAISRDHWTLPRQTKTKTPDSQAGLRKWGTSLNSGCFPWKIKEKSQDSVIFTKIGHSGAFSLLFRENTSNLKPCFTMEVQVVLQ